MTTSERRDTPRRAPPEDYAFVAARIRPGYDVEVVDMSSGGVLVESRHRLMPGSTVELYLRREKQPATVVRGQVVRCHVVRLGENMVRYHGAIAFERYLRTF
ncbi:MAG: PilZ domain-containing protein [Acidobacteriota bacterium]